MLSFHEIMKLHCSTRILVETNLVNSKLPKITQAITDYFKKDQMNMLRTLKNWISIPFLRPMSVDLNIYSYLYLIKNEKHRQAEAKLRSSNHKLRIETD